MTTRPSGAVLLRVALVADTHVNESETASSSPYAANALANGRARAAFAAIAASRPDFVIHLGDMVHPVPEQASYADAAAAFHALSEGIGAPLHTMPGNHDIGDKLVSWMPAGTIDAHTIALYRRHFGADYHAFDHGECRFVLINGPLINAGGAAEVEQWAWLEAELAAARGKRVFLFSHYPPYVDDAGEPGTYDNIDEPGRSRLLDLIRTHQPEGLFSAHVHNFWYDRIGRTETYVLPSTCFVRHDYAELFRIAPSDQHGRNDIGKLGHVTLDIHERGHVVHYHRSGGAVLAAGETAAAAPVVRPHTKLARHDRLAVDLRHAWAERMVIATSGATDEFHRKLARNDYPLMALWEMGLRGLRVPLQDLADPYTRRRMATLVDIGHKFQVHVYGLPGLEETALLTDHAGLVAGLELALDWDSFASLRDGITRLAAETGLAVILSRVNRRDPSRHAQGRFNHLISHGFALEDSPELAAGALQAAGLAGVQFTLPRDISPWAAAKQLAGFRQASGQQTRLYVKSTLANPARAFDDDLDNAVRFAEAAMTSIGYGQHVILDTLDDIDRGYFPRTGLVDRRFDPRLAGQLISALIQATNVGDWRAGPGETPSLVGPAGEVLSVTAPDAAARQARLICPATGRIFEAGDPYRSPCGLVLALEAGG